MNSKAFTYLLANPQQISKDNMAMLDAVIEKFPYFQSARALQLKGLKNENSYLYNDALKLTAAHTTDRDILFEYITSENFIQNEISKNILAHDIAFNEIDVVSEDVSEMVSVELDTKIKEELNKANAILDPDLFKRKIASVSEMVEPEKVKLEQTIEKPVDVDPISSTDETAEETLEIDKPLEFTKNDTHSFSEWLKLTKYKPIERSGEKTAKIEKPKENAQNDKERKFELIDKFIKQKPKLSPKENVAKEKSSENKNLASPYIQAPEALMTETLAKVYLQQKNYSKAIQAYKILILKYPEKSGFFADQIRAIEKLTNTEKQ